jgi:tetratricopeptide (TPR) repeat protein
MSEMLANHYFHSRNYASAQALYEPLLAQKPAEKSLRRRMVVCYLQTGAIRKALAIFTHLVLEDADFIINTHPVDDDCPCPELIAEMQVQSPDALSLEMELRLGMLWLYCDISKSVYYFEQALRQHPDERDVQQILTCLRPKSIDINKKRSSDMPMEAIR